MRAPASCLTVRVARVQIYVNNLNEKIKIEGLAERFRLWAVFLSALALRLRACRAQEVAVPRLLPIRQHLGNQCQQGVEAARPGANSGYFACPWQLAVVTCGSFSGVDHLRRPLRRHQGPARDAELQLLCQADGNAVFTLRCAATRLTYCDAGTVQRVSYAKSKSDVVAKIDGSYKQRPKRKLEGEQLSLRGFLLVG